MSEVNEASEPVEATGTAEEVTEKEVTLDDPHTEKSLEADQDADLESSLEALAKNTEPVAEEEKVAEPESESYEPDLKYTVYEEEKEIEEWAKPFITNKETEEKFKDLFERADALDKMKEYRDKAREELGEWKGQYETQTNAIHQLSQYLQNGDLEQFFHALDIPQEMILQYAIRRAEYQQNWTPEQRAAYDQQLAERRRASTLEQQYNQTQKQLEAMQQQQVVNEFNHVVTSRPEVTTFQQAFDQRNGSGAFQAEIAKLGRYYELSGEGVKPISQLVDEFTGRFGGAVPQAQQSQQPVPGQGMQQTQVAQPQDLPVLPNTGAAGGKSPTVKAIGSIEDLERIANEM